MTPAQFNVGLQDKLLGQVRLALAAQHHLNAGGSITLTSGIVSAQPIRDGVNATSVNAALEGFVRAAALELLPRDLRINVVSPNVLIEAVPTSPVSKQSARSARRWPSSARWKHPERRDLTVVRKRGRRD